MAHILVITEGDVPASLEQARQRCRKAGHGIILARHGLDVLQHLIHEQFDCVLMAVHAPARDGIALAHLIRERPTMQGIRVVAVSQGLGSAEQLILRSAGVHEVIDCANSDLGLTQIVEERFCTAAYTGWWGRVAAWAGAGAESSASWRAHVAPLAR